MLDPRLSKGGDRITTPSHTRDTEEFFHTAPNEDGEDEESTNRPASSVVQRRSLQITHVTSDLSWVWLVLIVLQMKNLQVLYNSDIQLHRSSGHTSEAFYLMVI